MPQKRSVGGSPVRSPSPGEGSVRARSSCEPAHQVRVDVDPRQGQPRVGERRLRLARGGRRQVDPGRHQHQVRRRRTAGCRARPGPPTARSPRRRSRRRAPRRQVRRRRPRRPARQARRGSRARCARAPAGRAGRAPASRDRPRSGGRTRTAAGRRAWCSHRRAGRATCARVVRRRARAPGRAGPSVVWADSVKSEGIRRGNRSFAARNRARNVAGSPTGPPRRVRRTTSTTTRCRRDGRKMVGRKRCTTG